MGKHGGKRPGAGRKPKAEEQELIEKLSPFDDMAQQVLLECIQDKQSWAVKMFYEYRYGKPKETKDISIVGEQPIFNIGLEGI